MADLIACPKCQRQLQVPESFFGQTVQCPDCQHQFQAGPAASGVQSGAPAPEKPSPAWEKSEPDEDRPRRRRPADDDDDDFRPSRPRHHLTPHRGVLVLIMGILSICCVGAPITGIIAWILGNSDLKEMDAGRMDPEGRSQTQIGRILGMVSTILTVLGFGLYCLFFVVMIFAASMAPNRRR